MQVQQARHAFSRISGALRLSAGLFSTLQDCSLLFRIKVMKKNPHKNKERGLLVFFFHLQYKDTPNLALTSLSFSSEDRTWKPAPASPRNSWNLSRCCFNETSRVATSRSEARVLISPRQTHILVFLLWTVTIIPHVHKITLYI